MKELDRLNREKDIKDFDECPRLPRKMKAEESVKVKNPQTRLRVCGMVHGITVSSCLQD